MLRRLILIAVLAVAPLAPVFAVQPDEVLADPGLEARARALSKVLRCPVCQGENIDDSNAGVARDLRLLVRERLLAGDSDEAVLAYVTDRYGEYVLFEPPAKGGNLILWLAGPGMLILGAGLAVAYLRGRTRASEPPAEALSAEEEARLKEILKG